MHAPHKTCNFRFTESKGKGEKTKQRLESKGRNIKAESKVRVKGEICREGSKGREGYAEKRGGPADG
jgi:hypothetical protein